ncbi:MAG: LysR family transcriptional regulator [Cyanobacteria bacterium P01_H01_bin.121]
MRLEQIQAFLAVAETGNFRKAAQKCHVTQSAISRQIQALEGFVGTELFHRNYQAKLTLAGECLLPRAQRIVREWQQAVVEIRDLHEGKQSELCIAVIASVCAQYLPPVLEQFGRDYPDMPLRVTALGSDRALKVLRDNLVDLAVVMDNPLLTSSPELQVDPLFEERIGIVMAADHPLNEFTEVPWSALAEYAQIVFKDGYGMQRLVLDQFQKQQLDPKVALELNTLDAFRGVVRQGRSVALLPESALAELKDDPLLSIKAVAAPKPTRRVVLVTTQDRLSIPPIRHFRQLIQAQLGTPSVPALMVGATTP